MEEDGRLRYPLGASRLLFSFLSLSGHGITMSLSIFWGRIYIFFSRHCNANKAAFVILAVFGCYVLHTWDSKIPLSVMVSKYEQEALGLSANFSYLVSKL